jgi:uncharacterized integral membrane protein
MQIFLFFALFISILTVIFAFQNNAPVLVTFAAWEYSGSLALVLLITVAVGALISFLFSLPSNIKTRWAIRQQRKKMTEMEAKITDLKTELELVKKEKEEEFIESPAALPTLPSIQPAAPLSVEISEDHPDQDIVNPPV